MAKKQVSQFILDMKFDRQPVELSEDGCNMLIFPLFRNKRGGTVLNSLKATQFISSDTNQG